MCECVFRGGDRLEVDLLLGTFATRHVPDMTLEQLREYEAIINCETIDIFNYVTKKDEPPPVSCHCCCCCCCAWQMVWGAELCCLTCLLVVVFAGVEHCSVEAITGVCRQPPLWQGFSGGMIGLGDCGGTALCVTCWRGAVLYSGLRGREAFDEQLGAQHR